MPQKFIGFSENAMVYNRQYAITADAPQAIWVPDALVAGARPTIAGNGLDALAGGVFDDKGQIVLACLQPRSDGHNAIDPRQPANTRAPTRTLPKAVFAGVAFDHFGHFLLESTARLWALPEYRDLPWLFLTTGTEKLPRYQTGFLELLGVPRDNIMPIGDVAAVEQLLVPQTSFTYHHHVTHSYRDTFRRANLPSRSQPARRIFLSRKNTTIAMTIGERELESVLADDGWEIAYPETLSPQEQALLFHEDNVLLGLQGSAMHLGLFAPPGRKVVHLCRGQGYRGYYVLDDLMEADAIYFDAMDQPDLPSKPITGPFLLNLDATLGFLRDEGLLRTSPAVAIAAAAETHKERLDEYEAWWNYTESQIRQNYGIAHDGSDVTRASSIDYAERAALLRPATVDIVTHAAALALKFESAMRAANILSRADEALFPDDIDRAKLHYFKSMTFDHLGEYETAREHAETAHRLSPGDPLYGNQLAILLYRLTRNAEARAVLLQLESEGRATSTTFHVLSLIAEPEGDTEATIALAARASQLDPTDEGLFQRLVGLYRATGQLDQVRKVSIQFMDRTGPNPGLLRALIETESALGNIESTMTYAERLYALDPSEPGLRERLFNHYRGNGMLPDLGRIGIPLNVGQLDHAIMIYTHALMMAENNRMDDALAASVGAVTLAPDNETIVSSLAGFYLQSGKPILSHVLITSLIEHGKICATFLYVLSLCEGELGSSNRAATAARHAFELAPDNETIRQHAAHFAVG